MDYQQALILAVKKEKKAFKLYTNLAEKPAGTPTWKMSFWLWRKKRLNIN